MFIKYHFICVLQTIIDDLLMKLMVKKNVYLYNILLFIIKHIFYLCEPDILHCNNALLYKLST